MSLKCFSDANESEGGLAPRVVASVFLDGRVSAHHTTIDGEIVEPFSLTFDERLHPDVVRALFSMARDWYELSLSKWSDEPPF